MILKSSYQELAIDPEQVNQELFELLKKKSSKFTMGGLSHQYNH